MLDQIFIFWFPGWYDFVMFRYLKIQLENNKDHMKALDYIGKLDFEECETNMKRYGKLLMQHASERTTAILKKLCTDYKPTVDPSGTPANVSPSAIERQAANPEDFFHIFINHSTEMRTFLEYVVQFRDDLPPDLHNTLLELYLEESRKTVDNVVRTDVDQKVMNLLKRPTVFDPMQSLLLCQMHNFDQGILYLYEQKGMYSEILQFSMDRKNYESVITACRRFGDKEPHLWVQAFWFFAKNFGDYDKAMISEVLKVIEAKHLLPSLMVVDILSKNPNATLDIVRVSIYLRPSKRKWF